MNQRIGAVNKLKHNFITKDDVTFEDFENQKVKCELLFDEWSDCIRVSGWNSEMCVGELKPKYENCVVKQRKMEDLLYS